MLKHNSAGDHSPWLTMRPALPAGLLGLLVVALAAAGCSRGPELAPVRGRVLYRGQPLKFGGVMFQPPAGQPARAVIQAGGTFVLTTHRAGDGATVGRNRVRITCFEAQDPAATGGDGERSLGKLLIPKKYTDLDTSGIEIVVPPSGTDDLLIELQDDADK